MDRLNVISFRKKSTNQQSFLSVLSKTDLKIVKIEDNLLIQKLISDQTDVNLFVFDDPSICNNDWYQTVAEVVKHNFLSTNLCLSFTSPSNNCDHFFSHFDDLLFWPCEAPEFNLRIRRKRLKYKNNKPTFKQKTFDDFESLNLVGRSLIFTRTLELVKRIAQYDAPVLITGETGTGKENIARSIHHLSSRSDHNFVPLNCGAIPDSLLETELFGHEKGAFTDAKARQSGLVEIANKGTLFLDEVDCLSTKAQVSLLRFLQTKEFRPLGSNRTYKSDLRVLAATNANLRNNMGNHLFREDLYFRLSVLNINVPPLRIRKDDIPLIANKLIADYATQYNLPHRQLSAKTINFLINQPWPGNVRELENTLLRALLLSDGPILDINPDNYNSSDPESDNQHYKTSNDMITGLKFQEAKSIAIQNFEQDYLAKILNKAEGNITKAAAIAGKERSALGKLLKKYNIGRNCFNSEPKEI